MEPWWTYLSYEQQQEEINHSEFMCEWCGRFFPVRDVVIIDSHVYCTECGNNILEKIGR